MIKNKKKILLIMLIMIPLLSIIGFSSWVVIREVISENQNGEHIEIADPDKNAKTYNGDYQTLDFEFDAEDVDLSTQFPNGYDEDLIYFKYFAATKNDDGTYTKGEQKGIDDGDDLEDGVIDAGDYIVEIYLKDFDELGNLIYTEDFIGRELFKIEKAELHISLLQYNLQTTPVTRLSYGDELYDTVLTVDNYTKYIDIAKLSATLANDFNGVTIEDELSTHIWEDIEYSVDYTQFETYAGEHIDAISGKIVENSELALNNNFDVIIDSTKLLVQKRQVYFTWDLTTNITYNASYWCTAATIDYDLPGLHEESVKFTSGSLNIDANYDKDGNALLAGKNEYITTVDLGSDDLNTAIYQNYVLLVKDGQPLTSTYKIQQKELTGGFDFALDGADIEEMVYDLESHSAIITINDLLSRTDASNNSVLDDVKADYKIAIVVENVPGEYNLDTVRNVGIYDIKVLSLSGEQKDNYVLTSDEEINTYLFDIVKKQLNYVWDVTAFDKTYEKTNYYDDIPAVTINDLGPNSVGYTDDVTAVLKVKKTSDATYSQNLINAGTYEVIIEKLEGVDAGNYKLNDDNSVVFRNIVVKPKVLQITWAEFDNTYNREQKKPVPSINDGQVCDGDSVLIKIKDYESLDYAKYANLKEDNETYNPEYIFRDINGEPIKDADDNIIKVDLAEEYVAEAILYSSGTLTDHENYVIETANDMHLNKFKIKPYVGAGGYNHLAVDAASADDAQQSLLNYITPLTGLIYSSFSSAFNLESTDLEAIPNVTASYIYNGDNIEPSATFDLNAIFAGDIVGVIVHSTVFGENNYNDKVKDVGYYTSMLFDVTNSNYALLEKTTTDFYIAPKPIEIDWETLELEYNGTEQAPVAYPKPGELCFDDECGIIIKGFNKNANAYRTNVIFGDTYTVEAYDVTNHNYVLKDADNLIEDYTIKQKLLTVTANDNTSYIYGDALFDEYNNVIIANGVSYGEYDEDNYFINDLAPGDSGSDLPGTLSFKLNTSIYNRYQNVKFEGDEIVPYLGVIVPYGYGTEGNYEYKYVEGNLLVNQRELTATWYDTELTYNGENQKPSVSLNVVNNDKVYVEILGENKNANATPLNVKFGDTYTASFENILLDRDSSNPKSMNYYLASSTDYDYDYIIKQYVVQINWGTTSFVYSKSEKCPIATVKSSSLFNDDIANVTVTVDEGSAIVVDQYNATAISLDNSNYALPEVLPTTSFNITEYPLTINWSDLTHVYDKTAYSPTAKLVTPFSGDVVNIDVVAGGINAAVYTASLSDLYGADAFNYMISDSAEVTKDYEITKRPVTASWSNLEFTYGKTTYSPTVTLGNIIEGDIVEATIATDGGNAVNANTYVSRVISLSNDNYMIPAEGLHTNFVIKPLPVTITWEILEYDYNGNYHSPTAKFNEIFAGDECTPVISGNERNAGEHATSVTGLQGINSGNYVIKEGINLNNTFIINKRVIEISWTNISLVYNGTPVKPSANISNLVSGDNCVIVVDGEQVNVGTYTATATSLSGDASDNYELPTTNLETEFSITPAHINTTIINSIVDQYYTGEEIEPKPVIEFNVDGTLVELIEGIDYTLDYENNIELGIATIKVTGIGNFNEERTVNFTIVQESIAKAVISGYAEEVEYTGSSIEPVVTVTINGKVLTLDDDYTVEYGTNKEVGKGTIIVKGINNYNGSQTVEFTIIPAKAEIEVSDLVHTYDRLPHYVTATYPGAGEITITYTDEDGNVVASPTEAGTYTVYIVAAACDSYEGDELETTLTINRKDINEITNNSVITDKPYTSEQVKQQITLVYGTYTLVENTDYSVVYENNINTGTAKVTITGTGNYKDSAIFNFTINKADPTYTLPTNLTATYGQTLADVTLPQYFSWKDATNTSVGNVGANTFKVVYNNQNSNYNVVEDIVTITVGKAAPSYTVPTGLTAVYGKTLADVTLPEGFTWEAEETTYVGPFGNNTFKVTYDPNDDNYSIVTGIDVTINVTKASLTITASSHTITYGDVSPTFTVSISGLVAGDVESDITVGTITSTYVQYVSGVASTYAVVASGYSNDNYDITYVSGTITVKQKSLNDATVTLPQTEYEFTGSAIEPTPTVTLADWGTTITSADYTVSYSANINHGLVTVTVTGEGNYSGTATTTFEITNKLVNGATIVVENAENIFYTGSALTPNISVTLGTTPLIKGTDYTVEYTDNTLAGTATVTITGIGNYDGEESTTFVIKKATQSLTYGETTFVYNGQPHSLIATAKESGVVTYENNSITNVGTVTVTINVAETANYAAYTTTQVIEVTPLDISKVGVEVDYGTIQAVTYNGTAHKPVLEITVNGLTLVANEFKVDYTLTYGENINAGDGYVYINGQGNYTGTVEAKFTINKADQTFTVDQSSFEYDGIAHSIYATATSGLTVTYSNNNTITNVGTVTVTLTVAGTTNYNSATEEVTLAVTPRNISNVTIALKVQQTFTYTGLAHTPEITVTDSVTITGSDYTVSYSGNVNAGTNTAVIKVTGDNNYTGTKEFTFSIGQASLVINPKAHTIIYGQAAGNNGIEGTGFVNGETVATSDLDLSNIKYTYSYSIYGNVGTYKISVSGISSNNYSISYEDGTLTVTRLAISINWGDISFTYNGEAQAPTASLVGLVNNDSLSVIVSGAKTNQGTYTATVQAAQFEETNYMLEADATTSYTISPITVEVEWTNTSLTYTGGELYPTANITGILDVDKAAVKVRYTANATPINVGNYTATLSLSNNEAGNYVISVEDMTCDYTIIKQMLTLTMSDKVITYNKQAQSISIKETLPSGVTVTYSIVKVVNGVNTPVTEAVTAGTYIITATINDSTGDYGISDQSDLEATLTINKVDVIINWVNATLSLEYTGGILLPSASSTNFIDKDDVEISISSNEAAINVGDYTATATLVGDDAENYVITTNETAEFEIYAKDIEFTMTNKEVQYNADYHSITVNQELPTEITITYKYNGISTNSVKDANTYTVIAEITNNNSNYNVTNENNQVSATLTITKAKVTISWTNVPTIYTGAKQVPTAVVQGLIGEDVCTAVVTVKDDLDSTNAGSYTAQVDSLSNSNYELEAAATKDYTIGKVTLTVNITTKTITYGDDKPTEFDYTFVGFVNNEDSSVVSGDLVFTNNYSKYSIVGTYKVSVDSSTLTATNYNFSYNEGSIVVEQLDITNSDRFVVTLSNYTYTYSYGVEHEPVATATFDGTATTEFTYDHSNNINAGTATVIVEGTGNFTGSKEINFTITAKSISGVTITFADDVDSFNYTNSNIAPSITVTDGIYTLVSSDYIISYTGTTAAGAEYSSTTAPTEAGTYNIIVNGQGNYSGSASASFTINKVNDPAYVAPTEFNATYGDILADITLPNAQFSWTVNKETSVGTAGTHTFYLNYTPTNPNYNTVTNIPVTVKVAKANPTEPTVEALTATYGDTLASVDLPSVLFAWKDASTNVENAGTKTFTAIYTPDDTDNYNSIEIEITVNVQKAVLTYTANSYEIVFGNAVPTLTYTVTGYKNSDEGKISVPTATVTTTYSRFDSIEDNNEFAVILSVSGTLDNYTLNPVDGKLKVNARTLNKDELVITYNNAINNNEFEFTGSAIKPTISIKLVLADAEYDLLSTDYSLSYANNTNMGTGEITITGQNNFTGSVTSEFSITAISLAGATITINDPSSIIYRGEELTPAITVKLGDTTLTLGTDYTVAYSNNISAGVNTATVTITGKVNYKDSASINFTINKATPSYTLPSNLTATYGDTLSTVTLPEGFAWEQAKSTVINTVGTVNTYTLTYTPNDTANYNVVTNIGVNIEVAKANLIITANDSNITYGDAPTNNGVTVDGLVNGDTIASLFNTLTYSYDYNQYDNVGDGTFIITIDTVTHANYNVTLNTGTLNVARRTVTITWDNNTFTYNGGVQNPQASISGTVKGETLNPTYSTTGNTTANADSTGTLLNGKENYSMTVNGFTTTVYSNNYQLPANVTEEYVIKQVKLTISVEEEAYTYGDTPTVSSVVYSGFIEGEDENNLDNSLTFTYNGSATKPTNAGTYTVVASGLASDNYEISYIENTLSIAQRLIVIIWGNATFTYNGGSQVPEATIESGKVSGDEISVVVNGAETNASDSAYTATAALSGSAANNYYIETANSSKVFTIGRKGVTIVWSNTSLTYNGVSQAPTAKVDQNDICGTDIVNVTVGGSQTNASDSSYTATATGLSNSNYEIVSNTNISFTISRLSLSDSSVIISTIPAQEYDEGTQLTPTITITLNGVALELTNDYTVQYGDNNSIGIGAGTVIITGNGNFVDEITITFNIVSPFKVSLVDEEREFTGSLLQTLNNPELPDGVTINYTYYRNEVETSDTKNIGEIIVKAILVYDESLYILSDDSDLESTMTIIPMKIKLVTNIIEIDYSSNVRTWSHILSGYFTTAKFSALFTKANGNAFTFGANTYLINGMHNGEFYYNNVDPSDSDLSNLVIKDYKVYGNNNSVTTTTTYLVGSTYQLCFTLTDNYEFTDDSPTSIIIKYKTAKVGSVYYTVEDAIKIGGTIILEGLSSNSEYVMTAFSALSSDLTNYSEDSYTLNSKLRIPFANVNADYNGSGGYTSNSSVWGTNILGQANTGQNCDSIAVDSVNLVYSVLHIPSAVTLTIDSYGNLVVGGLINQNGSVTNRGVLVNNGNIICNGKIGSYGYIKGTGTIELNDGSTLTDVCRIFDWGGGALSAGMNSAKIFPISAFTFHNNSCTTIINKGSTYDAFWTIMFNNSLYRGFQRGDKNGNIEIIGENGLFKLSEGYITKKASESKLDSTSTNISSITGSNQVVGQKDIIEIHGKAIDNSVAISISASGTSFTMSSSTEMFMPIAYFDITICNGSDLIIGAASYKFLPGTSLIIEENATLTITNDADILFYTLNDCITDVSNMSSKFVTSNGGLCVDRTDAYFEVNGTLNIYSAASIGGYINTKGTTGKIFVDGTPECEVLYVTSISEGTFTDTVNTSSKTYSAISKIGSNGTYEDNTVFNKGYLYLAKSAGENNYYFEGSKEYNTFTVSYITYDGDNLPDTNFYSFDDNFTVTIDLLSESKRDYYTFMYWYYLNGEEKIIFKDDTEYILTNTNNELTLYAEYTPKSYKINYYIDFEDGNNYDYDINNTIDFNVNTDIISVLEPNCGTFKFYGWYLNSNYLTEFYIGSGTFSFSDLMSYLPDNQTEFDLYGYFSTKVYYSVSFETNCSSSIESLTVLSDTVIDLDYNLTKNGYTFKGWYLSSDFSGDSVTTEYIVTDNVVLYAKWELTPYKLTLSGQYTSVDTSYFVVTIIRNGESITVTNGMTIYYTDAISVKIKGTNGSLFSSGKNQTAAIKGSEGILDITITGTGGKSGFSGRDGQWSQEETFSNITENITITTTRG